VLQLRHLVLLILLIRLPIALAGHLPARFSADAFTGVYTVGQADLMVSLDGDQQHNLYVDPQGAYGSDQQWYGDVGLGYRWIVNEAAVLGWYIFAGHSEVENSSGFWITNPGVEVMGSRWDARINAYIPVAGRSQDLGLREFNTTYTLLFTGHTELLSSNFVNKKAIQQIGNGADARVGYQLFRTVPLTGYLGAYFFSIANAENVRGGAAGVEYWFDKNIRVFGNYSYDNYQHSTIVGGLGISFGGVRNGHHADPSLSERLTDPVERYLANLGHGSGIPSKTLLFDAGFGSRTQIISTSIAFFSPTGTPNNGGGSLTLANCTFENPCGPTDFSQTGVNRLNTLLPNTQMFFNGGSYPAVNGTSALTLNNGQSVFSRTTNYSASATGASRSTFNGAFILNGNNTLEGVILNNSLGGTINGISSTGGQNITINNSQIGSTSNPYNKGLVLLNARLVLNNTTINASFLGVDAQTTELIMQSSVLNVSGSDSLGFDLSDNSTAMVSNSTISVTGNALSLSAIGVQVDASSSANLVETSLFVVNSLVNPNSGAIGLLSVGGEINMELGELSVTGRPINSNLTVGPNIGFFDTVCTFNGVETTCS
jgi:hypothetical protein